MTENTTRRPGPPQGQPSPSKGRKFPAEPLTRDEVSALIAACPATPETGARNRALLVILYRGGLRIAEALALKVCDVDPAGGTIRVLHGKGNRARTLGFDPGAMAVVQRWTGIRRAAGIGNGTLLCTLRGGKMSDRYVRALLGRLAAATGLEKRLTPHQLRHTHASDQFPPKACPST